MVTLAEIAQQVGVSTHTVSRVLNGGFKGTYPKVVRRAERIRQVAEELGYRPNAAAQAVCSGRFGVLGLLMSWTRHYSHLPHQLLSGLHDAAESWGEHLALGRVPDEKLSQEGWLPEILRRWSVDGLLINYHYHLPAGMAEQIRRRRIPAVWINADQPFDCVRPDDADAGRRLTEHLLERGHQRIAYMDRSHGQAELAQEHYSAVDRAAGYELAMRNARLTPRIVRPDRKLGHPESFEHARALWRSEDRPSAVITYALPHAEIVTVAAVMEGLVCGRDLEVGTFDTTPAQPHFGYAPITMVEPYRDLGHAAVTMLHQKIQRPEQQRPVSKLPFRLVTDDTATSPQTPTAGGPATPKVQ
ncbi:MAG: LacI family DNA-binding transcriptional regulator [Phycisphaeraceae bacterium]